MSITRSEVQNVLSGKRNTGKCVGTRVGKNQQSTLDYTGINLEAIKLNISPI